MKTNALIALGLLAPFLSVAKAQDAKQILDASGVQGGLVVVIWIEGTSTVFPPPDRWIIKANEYKPVIRKKVLGGVIENHKPVNNVHWNT